MEDNTEIENSKFKLFNDKIPYFCLLTLAFLLPFFTLPFNNLSVDFDKRLLVTFFSLAVFILWLLLRLIDGKIIIPRSTVVLGGIVVVLSGFISSILSPAKSVSFIGSGFETGTFLSIFISFILLFAFSIFFQNTKRIFHFFSLLFVSSAIIFIIQTINLMFGGFPLLDLGYSAASIVGKWNDLGIFFGLTLVASLVAIETMPLDGLFKWGSWITLILSLIGMVFVNFTLSWWVLIVILTVFVLHRFFINRLENSEDLSFTKKIITRPVSIVLILSIVFVIWGSERSFFRDVNPIIFDNGLYRTVKKVAPSPLEVRPTWGSTFSVMQDVYKEDAIFGSGLNRFDSGWRMFKPSDVNKTAFWNIQFSFGVGTIPTFGVTSGIFGVIAWTIFLVSLFLTVIRNLFKKDPDQKIPSLVNLAGLSSLYLWLIAFTYNPGLSIFTLAFIITGVYLAALVKMGSKQNYIFRASQSPSFGFASVLLIVSLLIASLSTGFFYIKKAQARSYLERGIGLANEGSLTESLQVLEKSVKAGGTDESYRTLVAVGLAELGKNVNDPGASPETLQSLFVEKYSKIRDNGSRAIEEDNTNHLNWLSLAEAYDSAFQLGVGGAYEAAKETYEEAIKRAPKNPLILFRLARLEFNNGNSLEGEALLNESLRVKSNYTPALFFKAQRSIENGDLRGAIDDTTSAALVDPNNIGVLFQLGFLQYRAGDYANAIEALKKAVSINPQYSNARYFLGLSYFNVGDFARAIEQFEIVLGLNPENTELISILENLKNNRDPFYSTPTEDLPELQEEPPLEEDETEEQQ